MPTPDELAANKAAKEAFELLKKRADLESQLNKGVVAYTDSLKKIISLQKNIAHLEASINKEKEKGEGTTEEEKAARKITLDMLNKELSVLREKKSTLVTIVKETKKEQLVFEVIGKTISTFPGLMTAGFGKLKQWGVFDMDKSLKNAALEMGVLGKQTAGFRTTITNSAMGVGELNNSTIELGVGIEDLAKMQAEYSDNLGRTVILSEQANMAMAELSKGTTLGASGAAQFASEMDMIGISAEGTRDFIQQTMNDAHKMGLNASKVVKNISQNIKLLNKYNFKGGAKGLASMAESATKLGVDMNLVAPMAEKLFDIEGAVDMSAQLQVMGGEWAKLADPFKLMNMARNDMDALFKSVVNATKGAAKFNKETKNFDISALEMQRLRKVAEATGLNYEELATAAKRAAKFTKIQGQMKIDIDPATKEFIENTSEFNERGEAQIMIGSSPKLLKNLSMADKDLLKAQIQETASLKERAKEAQNFDDALKNTLNLFKSSMLPVVDAINETLAPMIKNLFGDKEFRNKLIGLGKEIGVFIGGLLKFGAKIFDALGPTGTLAAILGVKGLMSTVQWVTNGLALAQGFNAGAIEGGFIKQLTGALGGSIGKFAKTGGLALGGVAVGMISDYFAKQAKESGHDQLSKGIGIAGAAGEGALYGAALGSIIPGVGTAIGAGVGAVAGGIKGIYDANQPIHDGIFDAPIHDGISKELGNDYSKKRGILQGGKITPIDNKDQLIASKPNGVIDRNMSATKPSSMKIEFGEIHFKFDELKVVSPGSPGIAIDLIKDPTFIRNITKMIHVETDKAISGGKINPTPK